MSELYKTQNNIVFSLYNEFQILVTMHTDIKYKLHEGYHIECDITLVYVES